MKEDRVSSGRTGRSGHESSFTRARELVCVIGFDAHFRHMNALWEEALGCTLEEIRERPFSEWIHPEDRERVLNSVRKLTEGTPEITFECRGVAKGGETRWLSWTARGFPEEARFYAVVRDITLQRLTETALRESSEVFRKLSELTSDAIAVHERGKILEVNGRLATMFGYAPEEMVGMSVLDLTAPEAREAVAQTASSRGVERHATVGLRKDGSTFPGEVLGRPLTYQGRNVRVAVIRPLTQEEKQREDTRRLREIGRMARGVMEDFTHLLGAINGYTDQILARLAPQDPLRKEVEEIQRAARRARELTKHLEIPRSSIPDRG